MAPAESVSSATGEKRIGGVGLAWLLLTLAMVLVHGSILSAPPYDDFAIMFFEVDWLNENHFDYDRLRNEELPFRRGGGPGIYLISAVPTLWALLVRFGPGNPANLIIAHVGVLALASAIPILLWKLLRPALSRSLATIAIAWLVAHPLFESQSEMLGLEIPLVACTLATLLCVQHERFMSAGFLSMLAFLIKPTGLVLTAGLMGTMVVLWVTGGTPRTSRRQKVAAFLLAAGIMAIESWLLIWSGQLDELRQPIYGQLRELFPIMKIAPDLPVIVGLGLCCGIALIARSFVRRRPEPPTSTGDQTWVILLATAVSLGVVIGIMGPVQIAVPRYFLLPVTMSVLLVGYLARQLPVRAVTVVGALGIAVNLLNLHGRLYPSLEGLPCARTGALWERSLEYQEDLASIRRAVEIAAGEAKMGATVIAPHPLTCALSMPSLGYVSEPVLGYSASEFCHRNFPPPAMMMVREPLRKIVVVHLPNIAGTILSHIDLTPPAGSTRFYQDDLDPPITVYPLELPPTPRVFDQWALKQWWLGNPEKLRHSLVPPMTRAELLDGVGRSDLADQLLDELERLNPDSIEPMLDSARQRLLTNRADDVIDSLRSFTATHPESLRGKLLLGWAEHQLGDHSSALELLEEVCRQDASRAEAWLIKARVEQALGRHEAAESSLERCIDQDPFNVAALAMLANRFAERKDWHKANYWSTRACRAAPYQASLHYLRAQALEKLGRIREADRAKATMRRLELADRSPDVSMPKRIVP